MSRTVLRGTKLTPSRFALSVQIYKVGTGCPHDRCRGSSSPWRLLAVLLVLTGTACPAPIVVTCYDGSSSASVRWLPTPRTVRLSVCDEDRHLDGQCQFPRTLHHGRGLRDLPAGMSALRTWRLRRVSHDQPGRLHLERHLSDPTLGARPKTSWVADT